MAGIKGNKKHANKTSFPNQKTYVGRPRIVMAKFREIYNNAIERQTILSWTDACMSVKWRVGKCDYWARKIPILDSFKKEIMAVIGARVNTGTLMGDFQSTPGIYRMKQLGETDQQTIVETGKKEVVYSVDAETIKAIGKTLEGEY